MYKAFEDSPGFGSRAAYDEIIPEPKMSSVKPWELAQQIIQAQFSCQEMKYGNRKQNWEPQQRIGMQSYNQAFSRCTGYEKERILNWPESLRFL